MPLLGAAGFLQEVQAAQPGAGGILDTKRTREQEDIYSNPPPLTKTLFGKEGKTGEEGSGFGPGQVGSARQQPAACRQPASQRAGVCVCVRLGVAEVGAAWELLDGPAESVSWPGAHCFRLPTG